MLVRKTKRLLIVGFEEESAPRKTISRKEELSNTLVLVVDEDGHEKTYAVCDVNRDPYPIAMELVKLSSELDDVEDFDEISEPDDS